MANNLKIVISGTLSRETYVDLAKELKNIEKKIPSLKINTNLQIDTKDIELYKQKMQNALARLQIGKTAIFNKEDIKNQVQSFTSELNKLGTVGSRSTKELGVQFDTLKTKVAQAAGEIKHIHGATDNLGESLKIAGYKMLVWVSMGNLIFGTFSVIKQGLGYIVNLDNALNEIRIVTNQTQEEVNALAGSYNKLGKEMGVTTTEIAQQAVELYRQGLSASEVNERMQSIIKYAKISGITMDESNKIITATANATGESVNKIIDIFAQLGDKTASGADEIGQALQRVAGTAESMSVPIEKAASWIATISSKTRESAGVIGNSMKSMMARYAQIKEKGFNEEDATNINMVTKALKQAGVVATDQSGQLRNFGDVIDDLMGKWSGLDDKTKRYVATSLGGTYQLNRFLTLLENSDEAAKNYQIALDSAGSANKKFAIYQESSQAQIDKFKTSVEGLYQNTLNSGFIKSLVGLGTALISLTDKIGLVNIALIAFGGFLGTKFLPIIPGLTNALVNLGTSLVGMGASANVAAVGMSALNIALPIAVLLLAVAAFDKLYVSAEEQKQKVAELTTEFDSLKSTLDKYKEIKNPTESQKEYLGLLQDEYDIKLKLLAIEKEKEVKKVVFGEGTLSPGIETDAQMQLLQFRVSKDEESRLRNNLKDNPKDEAAIQRIKELKKQYQSIQGVLVDSKLKVVDYMNSLGDNAPKELKDRLQAVSNELTNNIAEVKQSTVDIDANTQGQDTNNKAKQDAINTNNALANSEENLIKSIEIAVKSLQENNQAIAEYNENGKLSGDTIVALIKKYPELIGMMDNQAKVIDYIKTKTKEEQNAFATSIGQKILLTQDANKIQLNLTSDLVTALGKYYNNDVTNWKTLNDLKLNSNTLLINALGQQWSQYYKTQQDALGDMLNNPDAFIMTKWTKGADGKMGVSQETLNQLNQAKALYSAFGQAATSAGNAALKNYDLSGGGKDKKAKATPSQKAPSQVAEQLVELDRYQKLNQELEKTGVLLARNKAIQETADPAYKNKLLLQEIEYLKQKQRNLQAINEERRKERNELQQTLINSTATKDKKGKIIKQNMTFSGIGDSLNITNAYDILQKKMDAVNAHRNDKNKTTYNNLKAQYDALTKNVTRFFEIQSKEIPQTQADWYGLQKEIGSVNDEITKVKTDQWTKDKETYQKWLDQTKTTADTIVETMKKAYEAQKNYAVAAIEQRATAEDQRHETALANIDAESKKTEDAINAQMKLLDTQASTDDYNKQLATAQKERQDIANKISVLSLDTSYESISQRNDLTTTLTAKDEEIAKMKTDRDRELRKNNLQDQLDTNKTLIDAKKTLEDNSYKITKDGLDKEKTATQNYYDGLINDEKHWSAVRKDIIAGNLTDVQTALTGFLTDFQSKNQSVVEGMGLGWKELLNNIDAVTQAQSSMSGINYSTQSDWNSAKDNPLGMSNADFATYVGNKSSYETGGNKTTTSQANSALRSKYGITSDKYSASDLSAYLPSFDTGGMVSLLHEKEIVLNKDDTQNLLGAISMVRNFNLSNMGNIPLANNKNSGNGNGFSIGEVNLNIASLTGDKAGASYLYGEFKKEVRKLGGRF